MRDMCVSNSLCVSCGIVPLRLDTQKTLRKTLTWLVHLVYLFISLDAECRRTHCGLSAVRMQT